MSTQSAIEKSPSEDIHQDGPVTLINTFHPKPGKLQQFLALQLEEVRKLAPFAARHGWLGNRIYRARDGERIVIVSMFESRAARNHHADSPEFAEHLKVIGPLLERVESKEFDLVAENLPT